MERQPLSPSEQRLLLETTNCTNRTFLFCIFKLRVISSTIFITTHHSINAAILYMGVVSRGGIARSGGQKQQTTECNLALDTA